MSTTAAHEHEVSVRDLRNHRVQVLDRVVHGETLTVTKDGTPVAELRPIRRRSLSASELIARARRAPKVDADALRRDIDEQVRAARLAQAQRAETDHGEPSCAPDGSG